MPKKRNAYGWSVGREITIDEAPPLQCIAELRDCRWHLAAQKRRHELVWHYNGGLNHSSLWLTFRERSSGTNHGHPGDSYTEIVGHMRPHDNLVLATKVLPDRTQLLFVKMVSAGISLKKAA